MALLFGLCGAVGGALGGMMVGRAFAVFTGAVVGFVAGMLIYKRPSKPN